MLESGLVIFLLVGAAALLGWVYFTVRQRRASNASTVDEPLQGYLKLAGNDDALLVASEHGKLLHLNTTAQNWLHIEGDDPNLEYIASLAQPTDHFLELFAGNARASFNLAGRWVEASAHRIPAGSEARVVIVMRPVTPQTASDDSYDLSRALNIVNTIGETIDASLSIEQVLQALLAITMKELPADAGEITIYDPETNTLQPRGWSGDIRYVLDLNDRGGSYRMGEGISGWIAQQRKPVLVRDKDARDSLRPLIPTAPYSSFVGVPLLLGDRLIGTLELASKQTDTYEQTHVTLLQACSRAFVTAIYNAELYAQQSTRLQDLAALPANLRTASDKASIYKMLVERTARLLDVEIAGILLYDDQYKALVAQEPFVGLPAHIIRNFRIPLPTGSAARDIYEKASIWSSAELSGEPLAQEMRLDMLTNAAGVRDILLAPMQLGDRRIGMLQASNRRAPGGFTRADEDNLRMLAAQAGVVVEELRLYEQELLRESEMLSLQEITQAFSALTFEGDVLLNANTEVARLMGVERCGVMLYEPDASRLMAQLPMYGFDDDMIQHYQIPLEANSVVWHMWHEQDYWFTNDVDTDPIAVGAGLADFASLVGVNKTLIVPLSAGGRRFGILQASNKINDENFTDKDARMLTILAAQVAAMLENSRLFREAQRRASEAETLRKIAELAGKVLTAEDSFAPVLAEIAQLLNSPFAFINVIDVQTGNLVTYPRNVYGNYSETEPLVQDVFSPGYENSVFMSRRSFMSNDLADDPRVLPAYREIGTSVNLRRAILVPLAVGKTSLGELGVANRDDEYSAQDLELMETLAPQLAAALDRLRLYDATGQNLSRRMRELDAISRVTNELAQTLELDHVLDVIRQEATRVTEASGSTVALFDTIDEPGAELTVDRRIGDDLQGVAPIELDAALRGAESAIIEDYADTHMLAPLPESARSAVAAAILYEDRVVGALHLYSDQPRRFDAQAGSFLHTLAAKASLSYGNNLRYIENTDRSNRLRRRVEQLNQIFEIGQIVQHHTEQETLLEAIAYSIQQSVGFDIVLIALADPNSGMLRRVAQAGMPIDAFDRSRGDIISISQLAASLNPDFQISESYFLPFERLAEWAFPNMAALSMVYSGKRTLHPRSRSDWRDGDMLLVPLRGVDGDLLGVISLDRPFDGKRPERSTIEILEIFSHQATTTMENARLFAESRFSADQQVRLNAVLEAIARTLDTTEIVQAVADGLLKLVGFRRMTFTLHDPDNSVFQVVRVIADRDKELMIMSERRPNLARTALGRVFETMKDVLYSATDSEGAVFDDVRAWRAEGERVTMIVPLLAGGLCLGALHLGSDNERFDAYTEMRPLVRRIVNLAAIVLQNARLFNQAINLQLFNESVVESIQQGIVVLDSSGLVRTVNDYMKRTYGWNERAVRQDLFSYRPVLKSVLAEPVRAVLQEAQPAELMEQRITENGVTRIQNLYLYPLLASDAVRGVVLLVDDITERYELEQSLKARERQLSALTEASSKLSASLERETVLRTMFDAMQRVMPYDSMTLWRLEEDRFMLEAARGADYLTDDASITIADEPVLHIVVNERRAVADSRPELPGGLHGQSWLAVPMMQQSDVAGLIVLAKTEPKFYDPQSEQAGLAFANQVAVALQNAALFDETNSQMERLSLINRVSMALAQSLDNENILEISLREIASLLSGDRGRAYLFERELGLARAVVEFPRGEEAPQQIVNVQTAATLRHAFSSAQPLIIEDVSLLPQDHALYAESAERGFSSYVLIPLLVGGMPGGLFEIECYGAPRSINPTKIELALIVANQASIAVLNANLLEQTMVRTRELETLLEAAQATSFTLDLEEVLQSVVRLTVQALDMDDCLLMLYDNVEEELEVMVDFNRSGEREALIEPETTYDLRQYATKRQAMHSLSVMMLRVDGDAKDTRELEEMRSRGAITRIFVPLKARDEGIGLLQVDSLAPHRFFTHREARMAQALGAQAAISIENARLSTETANQVAQSLVINDLSRAISATMDINVMMRIVRDQVPMLTDADDVYIALYDPKTQIITFPMAVHKGAEFSIPDRKMGKDEVSFVIRNRRPLPLGGEHPTIAEVRSNLGIINGEGDAKRYLGVPLIAGDQVVGVLAVRDEQQARPFGLNDQRILTTIGTQLGATIQNAQLFQEINERVQARTIELQQERDRLDALYRITSELVSTLDIEPALKRALTLVTDTIAADEGVLLLRHPSEPRLFAYASVVTPVVSSALATHPADMLGEWLLQQDNALVVEDLHRAPYWNENLPGAKPWRSAVGALLETQNEVKGVAVFLSREPGRFSEAQMKLVSAATNQIASALKDAELYSKIKESNEQLSTSLRVAQEERGKSNAILESIADGVVVVDSEGTVLLMNDAAVEILDTPRQRATDQLLKELASRHADPQTNWAALLIGWVSEAKRRNGRLSVSTVQFGEKVIDVQLSPVITPEQTLGTVAVFRDITREIELDRRKSEFIANVSHELRTPLTVIKGYADMMAMAGVKSMDELQSRSVGKIRENTDKMATLVNDLLLIAQLDSGKETLNLETVALGDVIEQVVESLAQTPEHAAKQIAVEQRVAPDVPLIEADRAKVAQIVTNVVDNAFNYTRANGKIRIAVARQPDQQHVLISIADSGVGIPDEFRERVWDRFERYEPHALELAVSGTGLGLPIARQYAQMHHGQIWFESKLNKGTTFFIELPVLQSSTNGDAVATAEKVVEG
ncbi:MAG: GAF domain-containing protein [Chloroflexota bacterium]|nr:GAF domain-containing protein [Chloroflexota bacterium]